METAGSIIAGNLKHNNVLNAKIKGFTQIPNLFLMRPDLNVYDKMVMIIIKQHKMKNKNCWPSIKTIALILQCSETTVKKSIKKLSNKGLFTKSRDKEHKSNVYNNIRI